MYYVKFEKNVKQIASHTTKNSNITSDMHDLKNLEFMLLGKFSTYM